MNWTREQEIVIRSRNRNLLVSAAAGSGKTAVLVERIIRMVTDRENPLDIDQLLVMTFTNAAAAEMRERIGAAIEEKLSREPDDEHLQQQATLVQNASITTIDSFCLHIIREYFNVLDIDPSFRIADEGEQLLCRAEVMEELLESYYGSGDPTFFRFVEAYAVGKADGGLEDYIGQVYQFSQSNPWPEEWIERCRAELEDTSLSAIQGTEWMSFLLRDASAQIAEWVGQLDAAVEVCQEESGPLAYLPMLERDRSLLLPLTHVESYRDFVEGMEHLVFDRLAPIRSKEVDEEKKNFASSVRARIKKGVEKLRELYVFQSQEEIVSDMEGTREAILTLLSLAEEFSRRYQEKKRERNVVDFNDLEHYALDILFVKEGGTHIPSPVADEMSRQFEEILVDEYQDSNLVQEALISGISRERFEKPNVFMVGDVKQSIYKFRLARPELFLSKYQIYSEEESGHQKIELHQNFRSRDSVLTSINHVFYRIMAKSLGGITYTEKTALHPGASFAECEGNCNTPTELLLTDTGSSVLEELDEDVADYTGREIEARLIASRIRELTDQDKGLKVWDKKVMDYRVARYSDIVILLRSLSGWAEAFADVMGAMGIPVFAESRTGYFTTIEVETVLNLLSLIDNPIQDIPLAAVLKSPMAGVDDRQLAEIAALYRGFAKKGQDRGLYGAVSHYRSVEEPPDETLSKSLSSFFAMLEEFRDKAAYLSLPELLYQIYDRTGYYDYVSAMPAGETRQANLDMLVEKASAYESTSYKGLFHFIKYIDKLKKYNTDFGEASTISEHDNTVRLMSIHKSKGLEFPVVILAGMGKNFNRQDIRGKVLIDPVLGIAVDYLNPDTRIKASTLKKNVLKRRMDLENLGEELRILYVAMTRAKEKLILTAADRSLASRMEKWSQIPTEGGNVPFTVLSTAGSYLDWLLMSLSFATDAICVVQWPVAELLMEEMGYQLQKKTVQSRLLTLDLERVYDKTTWERLSGKLNYRYPYEEDIGLYTKMAVSELKQQGQLTDEEETAFLPTIPQFLRSESEEGRGAYRGTAYHRAMELLPFHQIHSPGDLSGHLERLLAEGRLLRESRDMLDDRLIYRFFESPLGERMALAQAEGRLHKEQQFVIGVPASKLGDNSSGELVLIQGIIDAYFEEEGKLVLVDYKTDRLPSGGKEILLERYAGQLGYYQMALEQMFEKKVGEKLIYSYQLGEVAVP